MIATPIVYGRLHATNSSFSVRSACANSMKPITFELDSDLNVAGLAAGADPMFSVPVTKLAETREPSILDIF